MYIKRIQINKYKKLENINIELGQLNVIIGKNNAGKTTLLNVIKSFLNKDGKYFKGYTNLNGEPVGIKITTNNCEWELNTAPATPKWVGSEMQEVQEEVANFGFLSAHTTLDEIQKTLQNGAAGFVEAANNDLSNSINRILGTYEASSDLEGSQVIVEEGDDYSLSFGFNLSKAISVNFSNSANSITNKGLGQQKEFVLRQFSGENPFSVDVLLIDEVENSLSEESLVEILTSLKREDIVEEDEETLGEEILQVIVTSHNTNTISPIISPNIISIGNEIPTGILRNLGNEIFVEGPSDARAFHAIYPDKFFIPGGGSNLPNVVRAVHDQGGTPKVIVDGDGPGLSYQTAISTFLGRPVKALAHGTIEDYYLEGEITAVLDANFVPHANPLENNLLQDLVFPAGTKSIVKNAIQTKTLDVAKIRADLDAYIAL